MTPGYRPWQQKKEKVYPGENPSLKKWDEKRHAEVLKGLALDHQPKIQELSAAFQAPRRG